MRTIIPGNIVLQFESLVEGIAEELERNDENSHLTLNDWAGDDSAYIA